MNIKTKVFEEHAAEYDRWFDRYPFVFAAEVEAIRQFLPPGESQGIEVGLGTGRFAQALGIKEGIEPAEPMRRMAIERGIETMEGIAENLPYSDMRFDFVLMSSCISYLASVPQAFSEAYRVLKPGGVFIVGFVERDSPIGQYYEQKRDISVFYKQAVFYTAEQVGAALKKAGFTEPRFAQTLFHQLDEITGPEPVLMGYGKGSFVVAAATKK